MYKLSIWPCLSLDLHEHNSENQKILKICILINNTFRTENTKRKVIYMEDLEGIHKDRDSKSRIVLKPKSTVTCLPLVISCGKSKVANLWLDTIQAELTASRQVPTRDRTASTDSLGIKLSKRGRCSLKGMGRVRPSMRFYKFHFVRMVCNLNIFWKRITHRVWNYKRMEVQYHSDGSTDPFPW